MATNFERLFGTPELFASFVSSAYEFELDTYVCPHSKGDHCMCDIDFNNLEQDDIRKQCEENILKWLKSETVKEPDLVDIVRCSDCRYFYPARYECVNYGDIVVEEPVSPPYCDRIGADFDEPPFYFGEKNPDADNWDNNYDYMQNGFCAWGERRMSQYEIESVYANISDDIKECIEHGVLSKEDAVYMMVRNMQ